MIEVAVIGTGYVGSVTGACLAKEGHQVTLVDIDQSKVDIINGGRSPIEEPKLGEIIHEAIQEGNLRATTDLGKAATGADVILLALPTPSRENGSANLEYVFGVANELGELIQGETIIATRSTVPVGTTERVAQLVGSKAAVPFYAVSNPEFLAEGTAVDNTLHPDRIVVGTNDPAAGSIMRELYHPFVLDNPDKILITDIRSAELIKLAANTLLAADITVCNVIAEICERTGGDYREVQRGVGLDRRIGKFTHPGPGYGGSCFPKDVRSLAHVAKELGASSELLEAITSTNEHMKRRLFGKVREYFNDDLQGKKIAVWGLSFKPETDDIRESAALDTIQSLLDAGAQVSVFDPKAIENVRKYFGDQSGLEFASQKYAATEGADALIIMTEWGTFRSPDFDHLGDLMKSKTIFDWRSIYNRSMLAEAGFHYESVGRQVVSG